MQSLQDLFLLLKGPYPVAYFQKLCGIKRFSTSHSEFENSIPKLKKNNKADKSMNSGVANGFISLGTSTISDGTFNKSGTSALNNGVIHDLRSRVVHSPAAPGKYEKRKSPSSCSSSGDESDTSCPSEDEEPEYEVTNRILYYLFCFGANLGNEVFYCSFFPYWFWNVDGYVCRRVVIIWCLIMYFGQALKDIIRWPRPQCPPAVRMEKRYELEYGMPSTHAMVGFGVPFSLLYLTMHRYEYNFYAGLLFCICWAILVCFSRIYLGMHSVLDVICGLLCSAMILPLIFPCLDSVDRFMLVDSYAPVVAVVIPLFMSIFYPSLDKWSTARGDTTMILAVGAGVALGSWANYHFGVYSVTADPPPYPIKMPDMTWIGLMMLRNTLGVVFLIATRTIMKALSFNLVCAVLGFDRQDLKSGQHLLVELPYKFATYTVVAFNVVYLAPCLFRYLGIERITFHTEY